MTREGEGWRDVLIDSACDELSERGWEASYCNHFGRWEGDGEAKEVYATLLYMIERNYSRRHGRLDEHEKAYKLCLIL